MKKRYLPRIAVILTLILFTMTQYQNCAPVNPEDSYSNNTDGEVRIVDDWNDGKISFMVQDLKLDNQADEVTLNGFCARKADGQEVLWYLVSQDNQSIDLQNGVAHCSFGGFRLNLSALQNLECGKKYVVLAGYDNQQEAEMSFLRDCNAFKSAQVD